MKLNDINIEDDLYVKEFEGAHGKVVEINDDMVKIELFTPIKFIKAPAVNFYKK